MSPRTGNRAIDLRSDTVSRPSPGMRAAMAAAEVGDDVFGDDPTVKELESRMADLLGKAAAVFFPSGTQSNLSAILSHCGRGDEMVVGDRYHSYYFEAGGASALGGVAFNTIPVRPDGSLDPVHIVAAVKPDDPHHPRSRLLCLENTVSGSAVPLEYLQAAADAARTTGLAVHLDGARLFNASVALDTSVSELASVSDTVSVCLSKGLGTPAGTVLAGTETVIQLARRNRKVLGGGMRQTGVLAAAGMYALDNNVERLADDHRRASKLAAALNDIPVSAGLKAHCATNMVFVTPRPEDHSDLHQFLAERGILIGNKAPTMRIVFHLDIDDRDTDLTIGAFRDFFRRSV